MEKLGSRVIRMSNQINILIRQVKDLQKQLDEKNKKPFSKVSLDRFEGNKDIVFDGISGLYKNYAVYKDEEEE